MQARRTDLHRFARPFRLALTLVLATLPWVAADSGVELAARPVKFGAFTYGGVWRSMEPITDLETMLGRQLDIVHWFMNWDHRWDPALVADATVPGRTAMISWQPHRQPVADIAGGRYDPYILSWALGVKAFGGPVYLRPFPEMNGDWVPWNGEPAMMVAAWKRMALIFERAGADNVRWVWSPNLTDSPRTADNRMEAYYPGNDYVDVLALDGYNWGTVRSWSSWRSFDDIFAEPYRRITAVGPQPLWLAEIASAAQGGDKAAWVRSMLASTAFDRLDAIIWFDEQKHADWRIDSSPAVVEAFRAGLARLDPTARRISY